MFKAVVPKCSLQTLASESPRALVRGQTPRPSHVREGRLRKADRAVGSRPRPFPSAHCPATWPSQAIRAGAVFLGILDLPPAHLGPGPFSYSRLLVWPSVCQLIPSTSQCHEVHTGTVLDAAQIVSESRSWMSLTLALAFPAQTVEHWVSTYLQAVAIAQVSTPGQREPCPELPCEPQGPGACGPCLTQATDWTSPPT